MAFVRASAATLLLLLAACGGEAVTGVPSAPDGSQLPVAITPGTCIDLATLKALANTVFTAGSPDANSVLGKLDNLQHQLDIGDYATAQARAFDLVSFILRKYHEGSLVASAADVARLVNGILCFAGLDMTMSDPANAWLISPSDSTQVVVHASGLAGVSLPAHPVSEPTLVTIAQLPDTFTQPGAGPLDTKLDQYPYFFQFDKSSPTNAPFTQDVVVGVCAEGGVDPLVRARLRLGHGGSAGFELTPPADAGFLSCPTTTAMLDGVPGWVRTLAALLLPTEAHAFALATGGVGGTTKEFSPFAPTDPTISGSGGVGGTASNFAPKGAAPLRTAAGGACTPLEAPIGTPVPAECRPWVRFTTPLGTPLAGIPVAFGVTAGGGTIAIDRPPCGTLGDTADGVTSDSGRLAFCWTLGMTAGQNTVTATPAVGGDAPAGVQFSPAVLSFDATANPPAALRFLAQPAAGAQVIAGTPLAVTVAVVDKNGVTVLGSSDQVTLAVGPYGLPGGHNAVRLPAVQGVAAFTDLVLTRAAAGYRFTAAAVLVGDSVATPGNLFDVVAGPAYGLTLVQGDGQSAPAGSSVPVAPTVRVTDGWGNPVGGTVIAWTAGGSSAGNATPASGPTDPAGLATTTWTLGEGANELRAMLARAGAADTAVLFHATGTVTSSVLNSCPVGGSSDPINAVGKTYAFWIPNPGPNRTIRSVEVYLSSAGRANAPTPYPVQLLTQLGSFDPAVAPVTATQTTVFLRGNNSEAKPVTFTLATPIVGNRDRPPVMMQLRVLDNPDNATLTFNSGPCSPGSKCKVPVGCNATEVDALTPYPTGTTYRQSVGLTVRGQ